MELIGYAFIFLGLYVYWANFGWNLVSGFDINMLWAAFAAFAGLFILYIVYSSRHNK